MLIFLAENPKRETFKKIISTRKGIDKSKLYVLTPSMYERISVHIMHQGNTTFTRSALCTILVNVDSCVNHGGMLGSHNLQRCITV